MTTQTIKDMSFEELKTLIQTVVEARLKLSPTPKKQITPERLQEIFDSIDRNRWIAPAGSPTLSQMILEEREQWQQGMS